MENSNRERELGERKSVGKRNRKKSWRKGGSYEREKEEIH